MRQGLLGGCSAILLLHLENPRILRKSAATRVVRQGVPAHVCNYEPPGSVDGSNIFFPLGGREGEIRGAGKGGGTVLCWTFLKMKIPRRGTSRACGEREGGMGGCLRGIWGWGGLNIFVSGAEIPTKQMSIKCLSAKFGLPPPPVLPVKGPRIRNILHKLSRKCTKLALFRAGNAIFLWSNDFQERKNQPKEEVLGRTSLRTSGQKLRSGPPNPGKTTAIGPL